MLEVLRVTFPFFALVLCGWLAARWRVLPLDAIPGLNAFVLYFALPCMLYRFGAQTPLSRLLDPGVGLTWLACALAMVGLTVATTLRRAGWNDAAFGALVAAFPNTGFIGVPLLVALFGAGAAGPVIATMAVDMVITSSLCVALSRLHGAEAHGALHAASKALRGMLVNPLPWAIALGAASSGTGWTLPVPLMGVVGMLADAASPTALFTIGAVLARAGAGGPFLAPSAPSPHAAPRTLRLGDVPRIALYKLLLHPALVFAVGSAGIASGHAFVDAPTLGLLVLAAALPSASNVPMLAERYGADSSRIARIVMVSTAAAFVSFSALVAWVR